MQHHAEYLSGHGRQLLDRRGFLSGTATALGSIALTNLLGRDHLLAAAGPIIDPARPYAARRPHVPAKAKNVIVIFCAGAVSQLETWDYKPALIKRDGQPLAGGPAITFQGPAGELARPQYIFRPRGQTGKMVSDLIPHLAELTDDIAFIHSLRSKSNTHGPAENFLSTGFVLDGFPSLGSWVSYALGSENQDLPSFVSILDPRGVPQNGSNNWGPGFLPAAFQGTTFSAKEPVRHLVAPGVSPASDRAARALLQRLNERHLEQHPGDTKLAARIASYELAARMQLSVPEISDLASEPAHILKSYGADDTTNPIKAGFARNCILARRLIERGVRFVQLFNGAYASGGELNWDGHNKLKEQYDRHAAILDQPVAALIRDLRQRGLLERTVVYCAGEFGRTPRINRADGRDHWSRSMAVLLAGGGLRRGYAHGRTDSRGMAPAEDACSPDDVSATVFSALGIEPDHELKTSSGRPVMLFREGKVISPLLA